MAPLPGRIPSARVLLLGDAGCGKTSLAALLSQCPGAAVPAHPLPTAGCDVFVRLVQVAEGGGGGAPKPAFVEFWDVGGDAQHAALRPLFYTQVAGLILVHDLSRRRSTAGLARWAAELGSCPGACVGAAPPLPRDSPGAALAQRLAELGVHVPVLVVGTRADIADAAAHRRGLTALVTSAAQRALCLFPRKRPPLLPEVVDRRPGERDAALFAAASLRTACPQTRVDWAAVDAFFQTVLASAAAQPAPPQYGSSHSGSRNSSRDAPAWAALLSEPLSEQTEQRYAWERESESRGSALWEP